MELGLHDNRLDPSLKLGPQPVWVPEMRGGLVMAQHAWSPMWTCGQIGREVHDPKTDPFEQMADIRKVRAGWMHDDHHGHMTTFTKEYLPFHQRDIKEPGKKRKKQLIASRYQTPRVNGVKVNHTTEAARIMTLQGRPPPPGVAAYGQALGPPRPSTVWQPASARTRPQSPALSSMTPSMSARSGTSSARIFTARSPY